MLAYLFWHQPTTSEPEDHNGEHRHDYETAIREFQVSLATDPPVGWRAAWTWRLPAPAWVAASGEAVYLDWYLVDDFESLGRLNSAAATGSRLRPHARVAALAGTGAGALVAPAANGVTEATPTAGIPASETTRGPAAWPRVRDRATLDFFDKVRGVQYRDVTDHLATFGSVWMRQMVLGIGPEFLLVRQSEAPRAAAMPSLAIRVWSATTTCVSSAAPGGSQ